jgi:glycosyltransferase involved in cell wall biosynthesis
LTNDDALITVLIPVRNGEAFLADAIESVLRQTFTRWKLVISDNHSTDRTRSIVERYLSDPRVQLLESEVDLGMTANFNKCLGSVKTKYYNLLCHDDFLYTPYSLELAYKVLEKHAPVPVVYSDLTFVNASGARLMVRRFHRTGLIKGSEIARRSILAARNLFGIPLLVRTVSLAGCRYDEALPYVIDIDLSIATSKDKEIYYIPEPLIANRYHSGNSTSSLLRGLHPEMLALAQKHKIPLTYLDRVVIRFSAWCTTIARRAFLMYSRRVKPESSVASLAESADVKHAP